MKRISDPEKFGKSATGKDALTLSVRVDLPALKDFLAESVERFESVEYKNDFGWIDQVAEVRDPKIIESLNARLIESIKKKEFETTWMAVPEIVDWEIIGGFEFSGSDRVEPHDDVFIGDFLDTLSPGVEITTDLLKKESVCAISAEDDNIREQWSVYSCLYSEQRDEVRKKTFLLSNGKWYEIAADFAEEVNSDFVEFRDKSRGVAFAECDGEKEGEYNERVARDSDYCLMDKKMIMHGGGYGKVEFCDLLTKDKKIIHVKHYAGSSVLSHLFSQGLVSGELFLRDKKFREKVNTELSTGFKLADAKVKPKPSDYEIIFAIISSSSKPLEIPFFSKVSLRNAKNRLEAFGYPVSLVKIQNVQP